MGYCSQADVERAAGSELRLAQLCDPTAASPSVDADTVDDAIEEASAWMDQWLAGRYGVPIEADDVPEAIRRLAAREAVYRLLDNHGNVSDRDQTAHEERERQLIRIEAGEAWPGTDPPPAASTLAAPEYIERADDEDVSDESTKGIW